MPDLQSSSGTICVLSWARTGDDVEARHLAMFGKGFRRIGTYVKLAQVGAMSCLAAADPLALKGANIGVFMGTGLGNTEAAVPLGEGILHAERPWCSPMAFAGSVGNAAAFYVARSCDLNGANVTVSQEELSFEAALLEAVLALRDGLVDLALVGGVDVLDPSREAEHLARLDAVGLPGRPAAGSGWLLLGEVLRCPGRGTTIDEVWVGAADVDELIAGVPDGATVLPGWRLAGGDGRRGVHALPLRPSGTSPSEEGEEGSGGTAPSEEDGSGEDGSGEDGSGEDGSGEDGSGEDGSGEDGSGEDGSGEDGSGSGEDGSGSGEDGSGTHVVAPAETRLMSTAAALRIVEVLDGTEVIASDTFSHVHRTASGTAARVTITRWGRDEP